MAGFGCKDSKQAEDVTPEPRVSVKRDAAGAPPEAKVPPKPEVNATLPNLAPQGTRVAYPTRKSDRGGSCRVDKPITIGQSPFGRAIVLAFHSGGGLAVWVSGKAHAELTFQALTPKGKPKGDPAILKMNDAIHIEQLLATDNGYLLLYRTEGAQSGQMGKANQTLVHLLFIDSTGSVHTTAEPVLGLRWRNDTSLRWRAGQPWLFAFTGNYYTAKIAVPSLVATEQAFEGDWYSSAWGPYIPGDKDVQVHIGSKSDDKLYMLHYTFSRRMENEPYGTSTKLPFKLGDFTYEDNSNSEPEVVFDSFVHPPLPHVGWNGKGYFVSGTKRRKSEFDLLLYPVTCGQK